MISEQMVLDWQHIHWNPIYPNSYVAVQASQHCAPTTVQRETTFRLREYWAPKPSLTSLPALPTGLPNNANWQAVYFYILGIQILFRWKPEVHRKFDQAKAEQGFQDLAHILPVTLPFFIIWYITSHRNFQSWPPVLMVTVIVLYECLEDCFNV